MFCILLPGFSIRNKEEILNISKALKNHGVNTYHHEWRHWSDESIKWDPEFEAESIHEKIKNEELSNCVIIGKSMGSYVLLLLLQKLGILVKQVILMGIPVNGLDNNEQQLYTEILKKYQLLITIIQNISDPQGSSEQVKKLLSGIEYNLIEVEASDHRYNYTDLILSILNLSGSLKNI